MKPLNARQLTALCKAGEQRASEVEPKLAAVIAVVLEQAGREAARSFKQRATDHLTADARRRADLAALTMIPGDEKTRRAFYATLRLTAAVDVQSNSTMVCVKPRPAEAATIVDPDGEPADNLHVTLAYLGEIDGDLEPIAQNLRAVAATHAPLSGIVGGYGQFGMPDGSRVGILLPDVPGLVELRVDVTLALTASNIGYGRQHGFEAHVTVDADPEPGELEKMLPLAGTPLHFDSLYLVRGDVEAIEIPLVGVPPLTASSDPKWTPPAPSELIDAHKLVKKLRAKSEPVRAAVVKTMMTKALDSVGIAFDVTNPLIAKALAGSTANITSIADTEQANVMRIISESYDAGLSIPDTALAIQEGFASASFDRAVMIARTELAGAVNGASLASTDAVARASGGAFMKVWMTAPGAHWPRHELDQDLDGQTVHLDEYFNVAGSQMMYPADPDGPAEEVINCRCTMMYEDASGDETGMAPQSDIEG